MSNLLTKRKKIRMQKHDNDKILNQRLYNALFGIVVLYGLILNYLLCAYGLDFAMSIKPAILIISYFSLGVIGVILSSVSKNSIVSFFGYNLLVVPNGLVLSIVLQEYGGIDSIIVKQAFLYTAIITGVMITLGVLYPKFFEKIGRILFVALLGLVITCIIMFIFNIDNVIISWISAIIYSLYIGYDIYISQKFEKTADNAVDCAIDIYLDIIGLFINILEILEDADD